MSEHLRKPPWLTVRARHSQDYEAVEAMLGRLKLHTVCHEANCPNRHECYGSRTATFMILGRVCTRNCTFCDVEKGNTSPPDPLEPGHVAEAVEELGLEYVVVTSVTRDDLPDGGAGQFAEVIRAIKARNASVSVEVLIPDFRGDEEALRRVLAAEPDVLNHNVETVPRLYPEVRPMASFRRSLGLLASVKTFAPGMRTKSGLMVGLGETRDEVFFVMEELRRADCDYLTIGQYLAPTKNHHPVVEYVTPETFDYYRDQGGALGFRAVSSGPFVRSSYHAAEMDTGTS
ncbi:MAG: lipoyl synthase [Spirochaetales bacterium]|nr:MAG: lipoyl synthase [Spirochaetales bacterium]